MVQVGAQPILGWVWDALRVGRRRRARRDPRLPRRRARDVRARARARTSIFVDNPEWETNNILLSLACARALPRSALPACRTATSSSRRRSRAPPSASTAEIGLVIDREFRDDLRRPHRAPARGGRGLRPLPDGTVARVGKRALPPAEAIGEYIGLTRLGARGVAIVANTLDQLAQQFAGRDDEPFQRAARYRNAYLTDLWQQLIDAGHPDRSDPDRRPVARDRHRPGPRTRARAGRVAARRNGHEAPQRSCSCWSRLASCGRVQQADGGELPQGDREHAARCSAPTTCATTRDIEGEVRRCKGGSSKEAVECAIKATTIEELRACEFMKVPDKKPKLTWRRESAPGSRRRGSRAVIAAPLGRRARIRRARPAASDPPARGARTAPTMRAAPSRSARPARSTSPTARARGCRTLPDHDRRQAAARRRAAARRAGSRRRVRRGRRVPARRERLVGDPARAEGQGVMSAGARAVAAVGRQLFALDRSAGGEPASSRSRRAPCSRSAPARGHRDRDRRGLFRRRRRPADRDQGAPQRVVRLVSDRWALVDARRARSALRQDVAWPADLAIAVAAAAPDERLVAVGRPRGKLELVTRARRQARARADRHRRDRRSASSSTAPAASWSRCRWSARPARPRRGWTITIRVEPLRRASGRGRPRPRKSSPSPRAGRTADAVERRVRAQPRRAGVRPRRTPSGDAVASTDAARYLGGRRWHRTYWSPTTTPGSCAWSRPCSRSAATASRPRSMARTRSRARSPALRTC